jgi:hypothetical protein
MREYRIRNTGEIITNIRSAFPQISMPENPSPEIIEWLGLDPVFEGPQPADLSAYQYSSRDGVMQDVDGKWYTRYIAAPVFENAEDEASYKSRKDAEQWAIVRNQRNDLLAASDWTQLSDAPVDDLAWAVYRQALRDITNQSNPFEVIWPTSP